MSERVQEAYAAIAAADRPEVWITLRDEAAVSAEADGIDPSLPLAGTLVAVKDNIDVAGLPTTAACPSFAYTPAQDAPAVARLRAAGAVVLGKTNLDQFATGLVGTRSPYGAVRDLARPDRVSGGSSSGSALAVALGAADLALGTDTAGSGRVPAAFQGLVGIKPTVGLVPTRGVVPACRTLDCVTVLARTVACGTRALWTIAGPDGGPDPAAARSRAWPPDAPLAAPEVPRLAVPEPGALTSLLGQAEATAFAAAIDGLPGERIPVDVAPLLECARLLYEGAYVAERSAAVGAFAAAHPEDIDPAVAAILATGSEPAATALVADGERVDGYRRIVAQLWADADGLVLPTAPRQPTLAEVKADPLGVSAALGVFTNFVNLLDLAAVAVPAGRAGAGHFGVSLIGPAFSDAVLADLAARLLGESTGELAGPDGVTLFVVGAHRRGQPLHHQLTSRGARDTGLAHTTPDYRLHVLATEPSKPGLVRVAEGTGAAIEGELWTLPVAGLGTFLAALPPPMTLGSVHLSDGRRVVGFACEPIALEGAPDITGDGSWLAYLTRAGANGLG